MAVLEVKEVKVPAPHYGCDTFHLHRDCAECFNHQVAGCRGCFDWAAFCSKWGMNAMADATWSRRAWISPLSTYLRGAEFLLVNDEGRLVDIA